MATATTVRSSSPPTRASTPSGPANEHPEVLDGELTARLRASIGRLSRRFNASSEDGSGLTPTQVSVLGVIARRGPLGLTELAGIEGVNPTMLSRVVAKLTAGGLVERSIDAANRRAVLVATTPAGRAVHERIRNRRTAALTEALHQMSPADAQTVLASVGALEALARALTVVNADRGLGR